MTTLIHATPSVTNITASDTEAVVNVLNNQENVITVNNSVTAINVTTTPATVEVNQSNQVAISVVNQDNVTITASTLAVSAPGIQGPQGIQGEQGETAATDWFHYIGNTKYQDATVAISSGDVLTYNYIPTSSTVYRYITTALTGLYPTQDAFYSVFDGSILTNLIVSR